MLLGSQWASGQGTQADYDRSAAVEQRTRHKVFREHVVPHWQALDAGFWYRMETAPGEFEFVVVDPATGARVLLFDQQALARQLGDALQQQVASKNLPLQRLQLSADQQSVQFSTKLGGPRNWHWNRATHRLESRPQAAESLTQPTIALRPSPAGGAQTRVRFVNQTSAAIQVYWLNFEGEQEHYGTVRAGDAFRHRTFVGHLWLITDSDDQPLALHAATETPLTVEINDTGATVTATNSEQRGPTQQGLSPDAQWRAEIRDHNVWLIEVATDTATQLSTSGSADDAFDGPIHWSPDSQKFVVLQTQAGEKHIVNIVESSPADQVQPKLHAFEYAKPGDRLPVPRPRLFHVKTKQQLHVAEELFTNAWSIEELHWSPAGSAFSFCYNQRGHQVLRVVEVDATSGIARALVDETSATFIDYNQKHFVQTLDETREILWMSERDGWNHLYLYDAISGQVKHQITQGPWVVRRVEKVDPDTRQIWFQAGGIVPGEDPYYVHLCRVNFDGSGLTRLTDGDGTHTWSFSPER